MTTPSPYATAQKTQPSTSGSPNASDQNSSPGTLAGVVERAIAERPASVAVRPWPKVGATYGAGGPADASGPVAREASNAAVRKVDPDSATGETVPLQCRA